MKKLLKPTAKSQKMISLCRKTFLLKIFVIFDNFSGFAKRSNLPSLCINNLAFVVGENELNWPWWDVRRELEHPVFGIEGHQR